MDGSYAPTLLPFFVYMNKRAILCTKYACTLHIYTKGIKIFCIVELWLICVILCLLKKSYDNDEIKQKNVYKNEIKEKGIMGGHNFNEID